MDKDVIIRIIKTSDNTEIGIGTGYDWKLLKNGLDNFGSFYNDLNFVNNGVHDGGLITNSRISKIDRTIKCAYIYPSNNDIERKRISAFFNVKDKYKVYMTYAGRTLWAEGEIYKYNLSMGADITARMDLTIIFTFANPYLKSSDDFGKDIAGKTGMIAFPFLCSMNTNPKGVTGSLINFFQRVQIQNEGDVETYCRAVFKATGSVTNPALYIGNSFVRVLDTMSAGDIVEMDFTVLPPTIKKNGVNYIGHCDRNSNFTAMIIPVGDCEIKYKADDGENQLSVSLYYNQLYASI